MRVLLDTNIILDSMLKRPPWHVDADAILIAAAAAKVICATTTHSLANTFYIGRKLIGGPAARAEIRTYLQAFEIIPVTKQVLLDADALPGSDFEDNMNIAAGMLAAVDAIITRNVSDYKHSPIAAWEPAELLRRLSSPPSSTPSPP